jgi:uncharacterized protein with PIN domain
MILDTSAIVAIALKEPGFEELLRKVIEAPSLAVGVPTLTEAAIMPTSAWPSTRGCVTARAATQPA